MSQKIIITDTAWLLTAFIAIEVSKITLAFWDHSEIRRARETVSLILEHSLYFH